MSSNMSKADVLGRLEDMLAEMQEMGREARKLMTEAYPEEMYRLDTYNVFTNISSCNPYDTTLESEVERLREELSASCDTHKDGFDEDGYDEEGSHRDEYDNCVACGKMSSPTDLDGFQMCTACVSRKQESKRLFDEQAARADAATLHTSNGHD